MKRIFVLVVIILAFFTQFNFAADSPELYISDTIIITKDTFNIPVNVENLVELEGLYLRLRFDSDQVSPIGTSLSGGVLSDNSYGMQTNADTDSTFSIVLVAQGVTLFSGSGKLLTVSFVQKISSKANVVISLDSLELNEVIIEDDLDSGNIEITPIAYSTNANLSSILVNGEELNDFNNNTTHYVVELTKASVEIPVVTYEVEDEFASDSLINATDLSSDMDSLRTTKISVIAEDRKVTKVYSILFNMPSTAAVYPDNQGAINIYPTSFNDFVTINSDSDPVSSIRILNVSGNLVYSFLPNSTLFTINFSVLEAGMYVFIVCTNTFERKFRLVKY